MMPRFSVVIPTYNRATLLNEALASVFGQRFTDFEVIVVDDGSTDQTADVLLAFAGRIKVLHQANRGPGAARNAGCAQARGRYLAFLDSDDLWFPWTLETYDRVAADAGEPGFIAGKPAQFRTREQLSAVTASAVSTAVFADYYASSEQWRWYGASSFVVRADAFRAVNGFTNEWINGEDADLAMRLGTAAGFVQVVSPVTFGYRDHEGSAISSVARTLQGAQHAVSMERAGAYPGGAARARERQTILTRLLRPAMLDGLRHGRRREAWQLYRSTFFWHIQLGRWRFLAGFPVQAVTASAGSVARAGRSS
jgi:hypothetical protein